MVRFKRTTLLALLLAPGPAVFIAAPALAQSPQPEPVPQAESNKYKTTVETEFVGVLAPRRTLDAQTNGFATAIEVDEHHTPLAGLARLVAHAPGVTVQSIGGLGQFSSVSLRGSSALQTPVFIDGVPTSGAMSGLTDLSTQPVANLDVIEIYRGYVPASLGGSGFGGAINLVTRVDHEQPKIQSSLAWGSFLTRQARISYGGPLRVRHLDAHGMAITAAYSGSLGNFPYFDNGGTPRLDSDDRTSVRSNNYYDRAHADLAFAGRGGRWRFGHRYIADFDLRGVPGPGNVVVTNARSLHASARVIAHARLDDFGRRGEHFELRFSPSWDARHYEDPEGQVGLSRDDQRSTTIDGFVRGHQRMRFWPGAFFDSGLDLRAAWVDIDERDIDADAQVLASGDARRRRARLGADVQIEQFVIDERWRISALMRLDLVKSAFELPEGEGEGFDEGRDDQRMAWSPRLAMRLQLAPALDLRGSFGRYHREPTMMELFGDRGYIVGNEGLRPESGTSVDAGLVYSRAWPGTVDIDLSAAGFSTWSTDLIHWGRSSAVIRPDNTVGARVRGIEAGMALRLFGDDIEIDANYTLLDSFNESPRSQEYGKPLAGRPKHDLLAALALGHEFRLRSIPIRPRLGYEYTFISGNFLDPSGRYELPPRSLHAVEFELTVMRRFAVHASVRNLGDIRKTEVTPVAGPPVPYPVAISDFIGYPLPGRSFWISLSADFWPS